MRTGGAKAAGIGKTVGVPVPAQNVRAALADLRARLGLAPDISEFEGQQANREPTVTVLVPCYNEEVSIGKVVRDFRAKLPNAAIFVYDNNSLDRTLEVAA